jgi:hypothetical protein
MMSNAGLLFLYVNCPNKLWDAANIVSKAPNAFITVSIIGRFSGLNAITKTLSVAPVLCVLEVRQIRHCPKYFGVHGYMLCLLPARSVCQPFSQK